MSARYDPLLLEAISREIEERLGGSRVDGLVLDRAGRRALLRFRDAPPLAFLLHPEQGFLVHATGLSFPGAETSFRKLYLGPCRVPPDERILLLTIVDGRGRPRHRLATELHTNQWNLLLLDADPEGDAVDGDRIRAALWPRETAHRELRAGAAYHPPRGRREGVDHPLSGERWEALLAEVPPSRRRAILLRNVAWTSGLNADWILGPAGVGEGPGGLGEDDAGALEAAHARYLRLHPDGRRSPNGAEGDSAGVWLVALPHGRQPYISPLDDPGAERVDSFLEGMRRVAREGGALEALSAAGEGGEPAVREAGAPDAEEEARRLRLRGALEARRERARKRREALARELESAPDPERLRDTGNLLLARLGQVPKGETSVTLPDFDGSEREVELDPTLEPAAQASRYFEEASRVERAREKVPDEMERAAAQIRRVEAALERLEREGPQEGLWEVAGGRPRPPTGGPATEEERLPYLLYRSSGGREIRVGRGASQNDDLTFHHSAPEDIWLHARQVTGAHVILRWGRRDQNPPQRELVEAALAAAVHSGARHSGTVAVDWTRRKYVRKPRKAAPGAVVPDRVKTLFVEPNEAALARLREEG